MEVVWVALITGLAAVVPQVLTWRQNRSRDAWERDRHIDAAEHDRRREEERVLAERAAQSRAAISRFVDAASSFVAASGRTMTYPSLARA